MELDTTSFKVEQLLNEVQLDYSSNKKSLLDALSTIEETVASIPEQKVDASLAPKFVEDLGVPADKVEFTFKRPESYQIVGSYAIEAVAKPVTNVDVLVRMPKCCFREKDFFDHRYHAKRCLYLSVIAMHLKSCRVVRKLQWSTFQNEARKPVLVVHLGLDIGAPSEFLVRIIPCTTNVFAIPKLGLSRNNIHSANQDPQATPNYNSSILEDMFLERNADFVKNIFLGWKDLGQALLLLKIWARNRSSIYTHDCLNGFLLSVILAYLTTDLGGARVKRSMKPIQIFRVTLDFLGTSKLLDKVLFLQSTSQHNISEEEQKKYMQVFSVALCDPFGFNLAFRVTRNAFLELREEARWTLDYMDKKNNAGFEEVFVARVDFAAKFDYCVRIYLNDDDTKASKLCLDKELWRISEGSVYSLLVEGFTDRANFIRVVWRNVPPEWSLEDGLKGLGNGPLIVGIMIASSEKGFRLKDVGPNPENKEEVIKYKKFWGSKVETRRFLDGTIAESVVWEFREWENHLIIKAIAEHVLSSHLAIPKERIFVVCDQLDFCLLNGTRDTISYSGDIRKAFDVLSKRLRSLDDLPLRISSVQLLDSASRRASVFPPEPHPLAHEKDVRLGTKSVVPTCVQPMEVMIQLEGSGNWPLDGIALKKTKTAFLLKIGESLRRHWRMMCIATEDEVNVLMSGYAFHLRMLHERETSLLKKQGMGTTIHNTTPLDNDLLLQSCHSSMLNGLQGRHPMYGPVVRLAKRWVASHLFSNVLKEEAVELLVAYLFLKPFPFYSPFSRVTGFIRFLRLLSEHDWANTPLIIDVNGDFTAQDEAEINENFLQIRRSNEANVENELSALFLATKYDKKSEAWTKLSPSSAVLKRIIAYARSADSYLTDLILQGESDEKKWESLFRTPLKNYDAVILLHEDRLAHPERLLFSSDHNLGIRPLVHGNGSKAFAPYIPLKDLIGSPQEAKNKLMVNFDPAKCLIEDIKQEFPGTFGLWYDAIGGDAIGLTWENPSKRRKIEGNGAATARGPIELLKRVGDAGKGLVKSIYLLRPPRGH